MKSIAALGLATVAAADKPFTLVDSVPGSMKLYAGVATDGEEYADTTWVTSLAGDVKQLSGTTLVSSAAVQASSTVALSFREAGKNNCIVQYWMRCTGFAADELCDSAKLQTGTGIYTTNPTYPCTNPTYFGYIANQAGWQKAKDDKAITLDSATRADKTVTFKWSRPLAGQEPAMEVGEDLEMGASWLAGAALKKSESSANVPNFKPFKISALQKKTDGATLLKLSAGAVMAASALYL